MGVSGATGTLLLKHVSYCGGQISSTNEKWVSYTLFYFPFGIAVEYHTLLLFEGICGHWNGNFTLRGHLPTN